MSQDYSLFSTDNLTRHGARWWLWIGVWALAVAGVFSVLLVFSRIPVFQNSFPFQDFFHVSLVVHVNLSVLIWFLAIAGMVWQLSTSPDPQTVWGPVFERAAMISFATGTALIPISAFTGQGGPLMSNYIPVLVNGLFFVGLILVFCGIGLAGILRLCAGRSELKRMLSNHPSSQDAQMLGIWTAALMTLFALGAFYFSYADMPSIIKGQQYYDLLFWGGGHILQFTNTQIMMVAWLWLLSVLAAPVRFSPRYVSALFALSAGFAFTGVVASIIYPAYTSEHRMFFTLMNMRREYERDFESKCPDPLGSTQ